MSWLLSLIGGWLSAWLESRRQRGELRQAARDHVEAAYVRRDNRALAKETETLIELTEQAHENQKRSSYDGNPEPLLAWLRKRADKPRR